MTKYQEASEKYYKENLEFIVSRDKKGGHLADDVEYKRIDDITRKIGEVAKQALEEGNFFKEDGNVNTKGILEIAEKSGAYVKKDGLSGQSYHTLGENGPIVKSDDFVASGLRMVNARMRIAREQYPEHEEKLEEINKLGMNAVEHGGFSQNARWHKEMDKFDEYTKNYEDIFSKLPEQDKIKAKNYQEVQNFDKKSKNLEAIERGNIVTLRDSKDGVETAHYQKNSKGELTPISAQNAQEILHKDQVLGKDVSEKKLLSEYYQDGLMAIKVNDEHVECMNIMPGKEKVGISEKDFTQQKFSADVMKDADRKLYNCEAVECSGVVTVFDPNSLSNGVYKDMRHYKKNEQGELQEISKEAANSIRNADPNGKIKQVPMINLGKGNIALKDGDKVISADVHKLRRNYQSMNRIPQSRDNAR